MSRSVAGIFTFSGDKADRLNLTGRCQLDPSLELITAGMEGLSASGSPGDGGENLSEQMMTQDNSLYVYSSVK
ncbi:hypothetical protein T484DRAFT_1803758 [Baffinella frigidus]|nr:hypothetical protein T484DRAFT_1803758 [Cryptophyta sp. CCMP2293]